MFQKSIKNTTFRIKAPPHQKQVTVRKKIHCYFNTLNMKHRKTWILQKAVNKIWDQ